MAAKWCSTFNLTDSLHLLCFYYFISFFSFGETMSLLGLLRGAWMMQVAVPLKSLPQHG